MREHKFVKSIMLPTYAHARVMLRALNGVSKNVATGMIQSIYLNSGTPQEVQNWSNPDRWIDDLLTGQERELAQTLWKASGSSLNPRYAKGVHLFLNKHGLLSVTSSRTYVLNEKGAAFLDDDTHIIASIDYDEGIVHLLNMLTPDKSISRQLLYDHWERFCLANTNYKSASSIAATLAQRLNNLRGRSLIEKSGSVWAITKFGIAHLRCAPTNTLVSA